ncbi:tRNA (adenosine(37)-N6)-threonylcarbamoyltransferase complex ATPase subunit type 1 TsaE [Ornithinibacillus bavariensis]|uniref:tRNA threonylcarbamoyladenosine biosynthesis protein TsaE n=1 Tax=Ornithinibacillus bavariensis TaxID=545502 RepID=A0A919X9M9_9BACI|nr:tRNA (adenosine(37)-N6)-threonylcarbamoyltransferase complex ATPase subunit type 1 TsaE [Ornithinibacillus bavariensis]GIO28126.1 tRNA (adenosine(37)-N6)-threonylcarbamoyltransferase complex ATPase subunit type 1 TsaE [Ornithinibacillus bavariensis]HAM80884.1 tRNA (adenosine(37)-N6)-threonylcarbamoyltransferase complex ATPase subunit type 1 TsaE [Ornithinibacillus sp.]
MEKYELKTNNAEETINVAERLANLLDAGSVITLEGDLGAGKTTFTKGLARGLGISRTLSSPTFTIVKEYDGRLPLYHMDVYRLEGSDEDIGFEEYFNGNGISVVEWAQYIEDFLPSERLTIIINYLDEDSRLLTFEPTGSRYQDIVEALVG